MHVGVVIVGMVGAAGCARVPEGRLPFRESPDFQLVGVTDASGLSAADLNGDHRTDLIVLSGSTHKLLLLLNREGNRFDVKSTNTSTATNFVLGDFNEDGNEDIATISHDHAEVSFFLGTGDGAFKPGTTVVIPATKPHCHMIAAIDINKDKHLDLLLSQSDDNLAWVSLGDGKGGFPNQSRASYETGRHPYVVATGDFNRDGWLDFATANWFSRSISIFKNSGTNSFQVQPPILLGKPSEPTAIAVGDVNMDGRLDLIVGNNGVKGLDVLTGDGHGGFARAKDSDLTPVDPCYGPTIADLNGDGKPDVVASATNGAKTFSYWLNAGAGRFGTPHELRCQGGANSICVADINGDGLADLIVGTETDAHTLVWLGRS